MSLNFNQSSIDPRNCLFRFGSKNSPRPLPLFVSKKASREAVGSCSFAETLQTMDTWDGVAGEGAVPVQVDVVQGRFRMSDLTSEPKFCII